MKKFLFILIVLLLIFSSGNAFTQENVLSQKVSQLADKLAFAVEGYVVGVTDETVYINLGQESGIVEGIKFEVVRLDKDRPFKMGEKIIGYPETEVGLIEITNVRKEMSLAKITTKVMDIQEGDKVYQEIKKVTRIAITEFTYGDEFNNFTRNVQDILYTNLIQRGMTVVEREKIDQVLEELGKGFSGMIDFSTAAEIGKMLGVEAIVVGTVADMVNSVDLRARLVDVEKGAAITAAQTDVVKDPSIMELLKSRVRKATYVREKTITPEEKGISEEVPYALKVISINTDSSWKVFDNELDGWNTVNFDDSYWYSCEEMGDIGGLGKAKAIWYPGVPKPSKTFFRKILEINGSKILSGKLFIRVCSYDASCPWNNIYLFVNDAYVDKCSIAWMCNEKEFNIASLLCIGKNVIAIKADFKKGPSSDSYWGATGDIKYQ